MVGLARHLHTVCGGSPRRGMHPLREGTFSIAVLSAAPLLAPCILQLHCSCQPTPAAVLHTKLLTAHIFELQQS